MFYKSSDLILKLLFEVVVSGRKSSISKNEIKSWKILITHVRKYVTKVKYICAVTKVKRPRFLKSQVSK